MSIHGVFAALNEMQSAGVVERYAIGGAVAATFYLEPVATLDVDVFVAIEPVAGSLVLDLQPIYGYLTGLGHEVDGEYILISGWPVQFLASSGPLVEEALLQAETKVVDGIPVQVIFAEHLAAICLETGRAKDKARLVQFLESGSLDMDRLDSIVKRHNLEALWSKFRSQFLDETK